VSYDAILFDFDGVLADTEPLHFEAWRDTLAPAGIKLTWKVYVSSCIGLADKEMLEMLGQKADPPQPISELWPLYPLKKSRFQSLAVSRRLVEQPILNALILLSDYRLGVVTSSAKSEIEPILEKDGVLPLLSTAVYGDEVTRLKPDPEPYHTAMERLSATRALVFEDSPSGFASARAAGCDVVEVDHPRSLPELLRKHVFLPFHFR
jgi:HAD superfamily hydrolase (TIGR01509 family)